MTIGYGVTRGAVDNDAGSIAVDLAEVMRRAGEFWAKISGELGHDGLVTLGFSDADGSGVDPAEDEADSMVRMANYLGDLAKLYTGQTALGEFDYADAFKAIRGLGRR